MTEEDLYRGREQTQVKHAILREYLERFAHIIGFKWDTITYVDCFSGPWNVRSDELKDSSFSIALHELRKARDTHRQRGQQLRLRCMFLEKERGPFARLKAFADNVKDAEVVALNQELTSAINDVRDFIRQGGTNSFPFIFIDPTGWKGFEMGLIAPLLRLRPCEVLINFMTDYIRRFIDHPDEATREQFAALFGSGDYKTRVQKLTDPKDREDELFRAYAENVRETGSFNYTCAAIILYPEIDRPFFHLIYATRNRKGVEVFKNAEKQAMGVMAATRAKAKQTKRVKKTSQPELFSDPPDAAPIELLRRRYLNRAQDQIRQMWGAKPSLPYDEAWDVALSYPLVWESDLKEWIGEWKNADMLRIDGMKPGQRVPKLEEGNVLIREGSRQQEGQ